MKKVYLFVFTISILVFSLQNKVSAATNKTLPQVGNNNNKIIVYSGFIVLIIAIILTIYLLINKKHKN